MIILPTDFLETKRLLHCLINVNSNLLSAVSSSNPGARCKIANWFASYQLELLTLLFSI